MGNELRPDEKEIKKRIGEKRRQWKEMTKPSDRSQLQGQCPECLGWNDTRLLRNKKKCSYLDGNAEKDEKQVGGSETCQKNICCAFHLPVPGNCDDYEDITDEAEYLKRKEDFNNSAKVRQLSRAT
ncbi:hypothetical protein RUM43_003486 [Polyplax serrata]|uniref:Uncharacterized protein n=1 Tax=Polyplax serrata TaxID=468196 RepID=A0AAN8PES4_POLSC